MANWLRTFVSAEDLNLVLGTYIRLTATCNFSSMGSDALFWYSWAPAHLWLTCTYTHTHIHTHIHTHLKINPKEVRGDREIGGSLKLTG